MKIFSCFLSVFLLSLVYGNPEQRLRAGQIADSMDIKTLAAQVILTAVEGKATVTEKTRKLLADVPTGGITLFGYNLSQNPEENRIFIEKLSNYMASITLPPFIASDQEGGAVQRIKGKAALPHPLSYWEKSKKSSADTAIFAVEQEASKAGRELRRIGISLNLAPLVEVLSENNKAFIKSRSYGPDPIFTVQASAAFIRGMESAQIAATLKHFPGSSAIDPHYHKSVMNVSETELEALLAPFREVIRLEKPAAIMVSHIIIPQWDTIPLSRSPVAVKYLREAGFDGIIIADDFAMVAAGAPPEIAVVEALAAGIDMIMAWPHDLPKIHAAILAAIEKGSLSKERVKEAAKMVIYQKIRYGLVR